MTFLDGLVLGAVLVLWVQAMWRTGQSIARRFREIRSLRQQQVDANADLLDREQQRRTVQPAEAQRETPMVIEQPQIGRTTPATHWVVPDRGVRH